LAAYEGEVTVYQAEVEAYQNEVVSYQTELALYEKARAEAVIPAETSIQQFYRDFQWIFVDKSDNAGYQAIVVKAWAVQVIIISILFFLILVLQRRKDVN
jgi:ASC-1-like (ASCH) protein